MKHFYDSKIDGKRKIEEIKKNIYDPKKIDSPEWLKNKKTML